MKRNTYTKQKPCNKLSSTSDDQQNKQKIKLYIHCQNKEVLKSNKKMESRPELIYFPLTINQRKLTNGFFSLESKEVGISAFLQFSASLFEIKGALKLTATSKHLVLILMQNQKTLVIWKVGTVTTDLHCILVSSQY